MSKATDAVEAAMRLFNDRNGGWMAGLDDKEWRELADLAVKTAKDSFFPGEPVRAAYPWRTNADLIYDVWRCGWVKGCIFDATPGDKALWSKRLWHDDGHYLDGIDCLVSNTARHNFCNLWFPDAKWDTVFFDPPYKFNGNPKGLPELSFRYGVDMPARWQDRLLLMTTGLIEMIRITKPGGFILVKCQDQVVSGEVRWQTRYLTDCAESGDPLSLAQEILDQLPDPPPMSEEEFLRRLDGLPTARLVDRFDMLGHHIPQPMKGREQQHAHGRPSTLLVFERQEEQR